MSLLINKRLTTSFRYYNVEAVPDFGSNVVDLLRDHSAVPSNDPSTTSTTARQTRKGTARAEPCFITKRPSYTLERAHWINAVRENPPLKQKIEEFLRRLGVVRHTFTLNDASNLTNLDRMLHVALDKYGFFAVTASLTTLQEIIALVEEQNVIWQEMFNRERKYIRYFHFERTPFSDAQYELVVLHPEHFLPKGSSLTFYTHVNNVVDGKEYVVGQDRTLRQSPGTMDCPRLPAFTFDADRSTVTKKLSLNVFPVVLNAEIKFRRYRRMIDMPRFPDEVEELMDRTIELVELIYWEPEAKNRYPQRIAEAVDMDVDAQDTADAEMGMKPTDEEDDEDTLGKSSRRTRVVKRARRCETLEQRRDYMQYLLSGRDFELDYNDKKLLEELGYGPNFPEINPTVVETLSPMQESTRMATCR